MSQGTLWLVTGTCCTLNEPHCFLTYRDRRLQGPDNCREMYAVCCGDVKVLAARDLNGGHTFLYFG